MKIYHQRGISILEVLFSLAIMCVIFTLIANYYFSQNKRYLAVGKAATQIQQLASLSYEWQTAQTQTDFNGISISALQDAGLLSKTDHFSQQDPWGGAITLAPYNSDSSYVAITLTNIPNDACTNLSSRMLNVAHTQSCTGGNYYISM